MTNLKNNGESLLPNWGEGASPERADEGRLQHDASPHPLPLSPLREGKQRHVLFLALSGIGNLIMQLPTIAAVKKAHPTWHITVWVAPKGTKAIAESQSFIDDVIEMAIVVPPPARRSTPSSRSRGGGVGGGGSVVMHHIKNILTLRKHHFDIGIVLSPGQLMKSAGYMFLAGIPMRIGSSYPYKGNPHATNFLTHSVDELENIHDIEQNIRLLEPLGLGDTNVPYYSLEIPEDNTQEAASSPLLTKERLGEVSYVGIHAGCAVGFEWKRWPLERFAEVASILIKKNPNTRILVFGGKEETEQNQEIVKMINIACHSGLAAPREARERSGDPDELRGDNSCAIVISASLLTTAAIMKKCTFFLANDSGLMHIAAAVGIPTLGLFGPTSETLTGPRGSQSNVLRADGTVPVYNTESGNTLGNTSHESLLKISVQMVLDSIKL